MQGKSVSCVVAAMAASALVHLAAQAQQPAASNPPAQAPQTQPSPSSATAGHGTAAALTQMGDELALMKARHQQLEWELKLVKQRSELEQQRRLDAQASMVTRTLPQVLGIDGVGKRGHATLQMPDGTVTEAGEGALLPNGMRIQAIRTGGLSLVTPNKQRIDLPVVRISVMHQPPGAPGGMAPLPQGQPASGLLPLNPARQGGTR